jgi:hypothetical protein
MPTTTTHTITHTSTHKLLFGGAGALTPILLNLLVVDAATVFRNVTLVVVAGYCLKVLILIYLGGIVAWLHQKETDPLRLFELGIVAPALLTALVNGTRSAPAGVPDAAAAAVSKVAWILPHELFAQVPGLEVPTYSFNAAPPETVKEQFVRGFIGSTTRGQWFVCVRRDFSSLADAVVEMRRLRMQRGIPARIYRPGGGPSPRFTIVVADWVSEESAERLGADLRRGGVDVFEWTPKAGH